MGYYTDFKLTHDSINNEINENIINALNEKTGYLFEIDLVKNCKWYSHAADMKFISLKFPDILFTLSGNGEEDGDLWRNYHKNGKMQFAKSIIAYEDFDESKLI